MRLPVPGMGEERVRPTFFRMPSGIYRTYLVPVQGRWWCAHWASSGFVHDFVTGETRQGGRRPESGAGFRAEAGSEPGRVSHYVPGP